MSYEDKYNKELAKSLWNKTKNSGRVYVYFEDVAGTLGNFVQWAKAMGFSVMRCTGESVELRKYV